MEWSEVITAVIGVFAGGGGVWGVLAARADKKKTPYDMMVEMLAEQKRFYEERNADYEREKLDSAEKSSVIMQTRLCKHRFSDPAIQCPVEEANAQRLKDRCNRCGYDKTRDNTAVE